MPEEALTMTSFTVSDASLVCGSGILLRPESRSSIEYLIPTNSIIVLDSYVNLTIKSNVIDRLLYDLIRSFDDLLEA